MPRSIRLPLELLFGVLVGLFLYGLGAALYDSFDQQRSEPLRLLDPQLVETRPAPSFELRDQRGETVRLSDFAGKPVVLNFWSVDCPPCVEEMPTLERLAEIGRSRGDFAVLTACIHGSWDEVSHLFPRGGTQMPILFDPEAEVIGGRYGTTMYPETFLIDSQGQIRARFDGARDWSSSTVLSLLATL